jgi:hypothetical protein
MIDRILFYIYSNGLFNDKQYGFTPQRGTTDAAMEVLEKLEGIQVGQDNDKRAAIHTDSKIILHLLQSKFKRYRLIESIRKKILY